MSRATWLEPARAPETEAHSTMPGHFTNRLGLMVISAFRIRALRRGHSVLAIVGSKKWILTYSGDEAFARVPRMARGRTRLRISPPIAHMVALAEPNPVMAAQGSVVQSCLGAMDLHQLAKEYGGAAPLSADLVYDQDWSVGTFVPAIGTGAALLGPTLMHGEPANRKPATYPGSSRAMKSCARAIRNPAPGQTSRRLRLVQSKRATISLQCAEGLDFRTRSKGGFHLPAGTHLIPTSPSIKENQLSLVDMRSPGIVCAPPEQMTGGTGSTKSFFRKTCAFRRTTWSAKEPRMAIAIPDANF